MGAQAEEVFRLKVGVLPKHVYESIRAKGGACTPESPNGSQQLHAEGAGVTGCFLPHRFQPNHTDPKITVTGIRTPSD